MEWLSVSIGNPQRAGWSLWWIMDTSCTMAMDHPYTFILIKTWTEDMTDVGIAINDYSVLVLTVALST